MTRSTPRRTHPKHCQRPTGEQATHRTDGKPKRAEVEDPEQQIGRRARTLACQDFRRGKLGQA